MFSLESKRSFLDYVLYSWHFSEGDVASAFFSCGMSFWTVSLYSRDFINEQILNN